MHETHKWNIKCQNESCNFMSLSTDELKKHEKQTHVFIGNYENQPHSILNDHDYTSKTAPNVKTQVFKSSAKLIPKKSLAEAEDVDAINDGASKHTFEDNTEKSVLDAIDHTRDAIDHNRCNFCNVTFPQKSRFDDVAKHFADIHDMEIKKGECIKKSNFVLVLELLAELMY